MRSLVLIFLVILAPLSYDAQTAPSSYMAEVLAPGIISTNAEEYRISFSPDGKEAYFARGDAFFPISRKATIYVTTLRDGRWGEPRVAPFSGKHSDIDPFISPDGKKLFFCSDRPVDGAARDDFDIWVIEKSGKFWGEPRHLGSEVNSEADELYPSVSRKGRLYFGSDRPGGRGGWDIYEAEGKKDGRYINVKSLDESINTQGWEFNPLISPDGSALLFTALNRKEGFGLGDLYLCHREGDRWYPPQNLGPRINTRNDEYHPSVSPDRTRLFFVRRIIGELPRPGDIYQIELSLPF
ncbi:MAG TPA: hypothetical protein VKA70_17460 [Blastocatellia bacterium]|nr:hypothetical protein [Blastocatellia bacterium]